MAARSKRNYRLSPRFVSMVHPTPRRGFHSPSAEYLPVFAPVTTQTFPDRSTSSAVAGGDRRPKARSNARHGVKHTAYVRAIGMAATTRPSWMWWNMIRDVSHAQHDRRSADSPVTDMPHHVPICGETTGHGSFHLLAYGMNDLPQQVFDPAVFGHLRR